MSTPFDRHRATLPVTVCAAGLVACAHAAPSAPSTEAVADAPSITPAAARETFQGSPERFTGTATVSMLFSPHGARTFGAATVAFAPGARTAWHRHPAGQTLVVTEGEGWFQVEGEARKTLRPGDVVWTPPGVRHWHGTTADQAMTHTALQGAVDGQVVAWEALVDDAQYLATE